MQPINYMTQVQSPFAAALQGYEMGSAMRQMEAQRQAQELAVVEQQRKMEQQQALQAKLSAFYAAPTVDSRAAFEIASMLPKDQSEAFRKSYEMLGVDEQKAELSFSSQVFSAANAGKPEMAVQLLKDRAAAEQDPRKAKSFNDAARMMELDPKMATRTAAVMLAQFPGGEKVLEGVTKIGGEERATAAEGREAAMFAPKLGKMEAEAQSAAVAAKFAESKAVQDLKLSDAQLRAFSVDEQIKKQNVAIAAMNARTAAAGNDLKRQELQLKVNEMKAKRDSDLREKVADVESARFNIDNMLNSADRVLKTPKGVIESATGPISTRLPTLSSDTADFEALVETLGSQAFLSQLPNIKGMGQLSNAEGDKLQAALQNLSLKQSPERLVENVREAQRLLLKVRKNVDTRFGVPSNVPDTPAATTAAPRGPGQKPQTVDDLVKRYGG
jgi:hypothetical protein